MTGRCSSTCQSSLFYFRRCSTAAAAAVDYWTRHHTTNHRVVCVCVLRSQVNCAKTDEPIEMQSGIKNRVAQETTRLGCTLTSPGEYECNGGDTVCCYYQPVTTVLSWSLFTPSTDNLLRVQIHKWFHITYTHITF